MDTQYRVLTKTGDTLSPVIKSNGFDITDTPSYSHSMVVQLNGEPVVIPVFNDCYIPEGFYKTAQSVPLYKFLQDLHDAGGEVIPTN